MDEFFLCSFGNGGIEPRERCSGLIGNGRQRANFAGMVELVDTLDLGSSGASRGSSSLSTRTNLYNVLASFGRIKQ